MRISVVLALPLSIAAVACASSPPVAEPAPASADTATETRDSTPPTAAPSEKTDPIFRGEEPAPLSPMVIRGLDDHHPGPIRVTDGGEIWFDLDHPPPDDRRAAGIRLRSSWRIERTGTSVADELVYALDFGSGTIGPFGADERWQVPPHIHCQLVRERAVRCTSSWGHEPPLDMYLRVETDGTIVGLDRLARAPLARVEPAPSTDAQAWQALFVYLQQLFAGDRHGDDAHDIGF